MWPFLLSLFRFFSEIDTVIDTVIEVSLYRKNDFCSLGSLPGAVRPWVVEAMVLWCACLISKLNRDRLFLRVLFRGLFRRKSLLWIL